jgi:hypothetical protein
MGDVPNWVLPDDREPDKPEPVAARLDSSAPQSGWDSSHGPPRRCGLSTIVAGVLGPPLVYLACVEFDNAVDAELKTVWTVLGLTLVPTLVLTAVVTAAGIVRPTLLGRVSIGLCFGLLAYVTCVPMLYVALAISFTKTWSF